EGRAREATDHGMDRLHAHGRRRGTQAEQRSPGDPRTGDVLAMRRSLLALLPLILVALVWAAGGCATPLGGAHAALITNRTQLIGGDRALGDVGDYIIENDRIRLVVQQPGFSRGFGVYGGSLIDADLRRPSETGTSGEAPGNDQFGELFPAFF